MCALIIIDMTFILYCNGVFLKLIITLFYHLLTLRQIRL